ncbi:zinc ribbon domain-containing protein [Streptomyces cyaneofuscatus]|uniref:zinc ribbon domain-containing protein n=1 Tax=Streptomyces cyaneofuscatus TaxID=66883 RepID=UPI0036481277
MAMVECRECGHSVSDAAHLCPHCGIESPGGVTQLKIRRVSRLTGSLVPLSVWVDSQQVGILGSEEVSRTPSLLGSTALRADWSRPAVKPVRRNSTFLPGGVW